MVRAVSETVTLLKKHLKNKKRTHFLNGSFHSRQSNDSSHSI